jgi:hypothetical protein
MAIHADLREHIGNVANVGDIDEVGKAEVRIIVISLKEEKKMENDLDEMQSLAKEARGIKDEKSRRRVIAKISERLADLFEATMREKRNLRLAWLANSREILILKKQSKGPHGHEHYDAMYHADDHLMETLHKMGVKEARLLMLSQKEDRQLYDLLEEATNGLHMYERGTITSDQFIDGVISETPTIKRLLKQIKRNLKLVLREERKTIDLVEEMQKKAR